MGSTKLTKSIAQTGILLAVAIALSFIQIPLFLGAQITLASTLPICIISFREKSGWSFLSAFIFSCFQFAIAVIRDGILGWGLISSSLFWCIFLDYILAFTCIGFCTFFKNLKEKWYFFAIFLVFFIRYICHVLSGYLIFTNLEQWSIFGKVFEGKSLLYSVCFNAVFMVPEFAITSVVFLAIMKIPYLKNLIFKK